MPRETDTLENQVTYGNISILPNSNIDEGDGSLEVYGTIYTDAIISNTIDADVNIEGILFNNNKITIPATIVPTNTLTNSQMFYTDTSDLAFKSIDSTGIITVYQPTTTQGDIIVNNGITTTRLPVGTTGQVLTVSPSSGVGISWQTPSITPTTNISSINSTSITFNTTQNNDVMPLPVGSNVLSIYPVQSTGCSANYIMSKSSPNIVGNITRLNSNSSTSTNSTFTSSYPAYTGFTLNTNKSDIIGPYRYIDSSQYTSSTITLTGTTSSLYKLNTTGVFFINISNYITGPCATFMICKSYSGSASAQMFQVTSSPGTSPFTQLNVSWPSNSGLSISKTTSSYNGVYYIVDNFQYTNLQTTVTLSGTSTIIIPPPTFSYYKQQSFYISIVSQVTNGPNAIFYISKNINTNNGNIGSTVSFGYPSGERLNVTWNTNSLLQLSKNGTNFDGTYLITFTKLN